MDYYYDFYEEFAGIALFIMALVIAVFVTSIIANWKMYKKAGKNGWECIIPFYGYWVLTEIAGLEWWWFLLAIVDSIVSFVGSDDLTGIANLVSLFASFNIYYNIARKFNKTKGTAVVAGIFSFVFVYIFGLSKKEIYNANIPVSKNGVFGTPEANMNNNYHNTQYNNVQSTGNVDINNNYKNYSFCGNCGVKLENGTKFCPNCGKQNN